MSNENNEEKIRSSLRLRNLSAKGKELKFRKPDYVYDGELENLTNNLEVSAIPNFNRPRSSSWTSSGGVAVVELRKKYKEKIDSPKSQIQPKKKGRNKTSSMCKKCANIDTCDNSVNAQEEEDKEISFKGTQPKLSQQRLDSWFSANASVLNIDSCANIDTPLTPGNAIPRQTNADYGSDICSYTEFKGQLSLNTTDEPSETALNSELLEETSTVQTRNSESSIESSIMNKEELKTMFREVIREMKDEITKDFKDSMEESLKNLKTEITTEVTALKQVRSEVDTNIANFKRGAEKVDLSVKTCQIQLSEVIGVCIRQDQMLKECQEEIETLKAYKDRKLLRINGLIEQKNENCKAVVSAFFKEKLEISKEIDMLEVYRLGKGTNRTMKVMLKNPRDKGLIFGNTKKLANLTNSENKPYSVSDQLTAKRNAARNRARHIVRQNKKSTGEQLAMQFEKGKLLIEGKDYQKKIKPPSCKEVLMANKETRLARMNLKLSRSRNIEVENQLFIGYTLAVKTMEEVNLAYGKLRTLHGDARHVIGACKLPHREFHTHSDFYDDDEHGGGAFLLELLESSGIMNRAVFVIRVYEGDHIGAIRFSAMKDAVRSALDQAGQNSVTGKYDLLWDKPKGTRGGRGHYRGHPTPPRGGYQSLDTHTPSLDVNPREVWSAVQDGSYGSAAVPTHIQELSKPANIMI